MEIAGELREVVDLRDVQQLSYDEIAQITGLPMGTVRSRINRGADEAAESPRGRLPSQGGA